MILSSYDPQANLVRVARDAGRLNQTTTLAYNARGDATSLTDPRGAVTLSAYDANRRLTSTTGPGTPANPQGLTTAFQYDPDGRVLAIAQSAGTNPLTTRATTYTPTGKPATSTDPKGNPATRKTRANQTAGDRT